LVETQNPPKITNMFNESILTSCNGSCPAGINIPGFIALILGKDEKQAYRLIRNSAPFPALLGRTCPHPCESSCRRIETDQSINICVLKAVAADKVKVDYNFLDESKSPLKNKSVGIIGGGPSGLSCAYFLARMGYSVTVYEAQSVAGGMASLGIPEYRAPMDIIQWEIDAIKRLGVEIRLNTEVGKDISFFDLEMKHNAIYIATGLPKGTYINLKGEKLENVYQAVDFLKDLKLALYYKKPTPKIGKNVIVIGGGNVAVDAVRSAKKLGAKEVRLICLEQRQEMPAWQHEIEEALEEGVCLDNGWGPQEITTDSKGKVDGIRFKQCTHVFDEKGKFSPQYCEDETIYYKADTIIMAIGQMPETTFLQGVPGIQFFRGKWIIADLNSTKTDRKGVFAGGDVVKPGLLIDAIALGRLSAISIDKYLGGTGELFLDQDIEIPKPNLNWKEWHTQRNNPKFIDLDYRGTSFKEVSQGLTSKAAIDECDRCLCCEKSTINPDKCIGCGTCVKNCPYDAILFDIKVKKYVFGDRTMRTASVDPKLCHTCGVCLSDCPVNAITFIKWSNEHYYQEIKTQLDSLK
jgi:NADPH-dependent glutamate synthase beta subunit-like oxidoreductase/NAD-dependent dihydropyrimidine dehydrogenase PreA subunit